MTGKWAERLTRWWPYTHQGVNYAVDHLHPFRFRIELLASAQHVARTVEIRVGFSCHTFTREPTAADAGVVLYHQREGRVFCPERHGLSTSLPGVVRGLPGRSCFFARRDNYFVVETPDLLAVDQEYRVFFDVRNVGEPDAVLVYVQSAYTADKARGTPGGVRRKKVGFRVLVNHALQGTKPPEPP
jgi:hypothetical protein